MHHAAALHGKALAPHRRRVRWCLPKPSIYPEKIHEAMRYSTLWGQASSAPTGTGSFRDGGGSRFTEIQQAAYRLGAAIEMLHAYSLVHDDLPCMDDDDFRRGKPSNHKVFGDGLAVLAGDGLLTEAFALLGQLEELGVPATTVTQVIREMAGAAGSRASSADKLLIWNQRKKHICRYSKLSTPTRLVPVPGCSSGVERLCGC